MKTRREFTKTISNGSMGTLVLGAVACSTREKKTKKVVWPSDKMNLTFVGIGRIIRIQPVNKN